MKTLMVTGATSGLGLEIVKVASKRCKVIACGRNAEVLNKVQKRYKCGVIQGDINDWTWGEPPTINAMRTVTKSQKVDVFIHCAGVYHKVPLMADYYADAAYDADAAHVLNTNLVTPVLLLRRVITTMIQRGTGTIAVINSLAGKQGNAEEAAYCASKFGLRGFVESVRYDCAKSGVRIFSVYPGAMQTPMAKHRDDYGILIQPREVAELLVDICLKYHTLRVDDLEIMRTAY